MLILRLNQNFLTKKFEFDNKFIKTSPTFIKTYNFDLNVRTILSYIIINWLVIIHLKTQRNLVI
jgi:hypothetical protein